uniref:Uncharacterized protein n=1 Tax=Steinernema glaseri TaxID=37863 RepID=A0A1I7ZF51_9BILA
MLGRCAGNWLEDGRPPQNIDVLSGGGAFRSQSEEPRKGTDERVDFRSRAKTEKGALNRGKVDKVDLGSWALVLGYVVPGAVEGL